MPKRRPKLKRGTTHYGKPKAAVTLTPTSWDMGASGPANRDRLAEEDAAEIDPATGKKQPNPNGIKRWRRHTWVEIYAGKGRLTSGQHAAAQNLFSAYSGHPLRDPLAAIGETVDRERYTDPQSAIVDARRQFRQMWDRIPMYCRPVVEHVVLEDKPLRAMVGCYNGRTEDRYMERLAIGLDAIS